MEKFEQQYLDFKNRCMEKDGEWLYNHYYKIGFYENLHDCLEGIETEESVKKIIELIETEKITMEGMFGEFIDLEWSTYDNWENFLDFFDYIIQKY